MQFHHHFGTWLLNQWKSIQQTQAAIHTKMKTRLSLDCDVSHVFVPIFRERSLSTFLSSFITDYYYNISVQRSLYCNKAPSVYVSLLVSFSKPPRRRQRERHQTKSLVSKTMVLHVRFESFRTFLCWPLQNNNVTWNDKVARILENVHRNG